jgi:hypothetical protein
MRLKGLRVENKNIKKNREERRGEGKRYSMALWHSGRAQKLNGGRVTTFEPLLLPLSVA